MGFNSGFKGLMYLYILPDDGQMNDCNMLQENNNKRRYCVQVLCSC